MASVEAFPIPMSVEARLLFTEVLSYRNARLTWRDRDVLRFVDEHGYAFFEDIKALGFPSDEATWKRLHLLREAGWIRSISVGEIPNVRRLRMEWQSIGISPEDQEFLKKKVYYRNPLLQKGEPRLEFPVEMIQHQLALGHVRNVVVAELEAAEKRAGTVPHITTERHIIRSGDKGSLVPDLIFSIDSRQIAVEYERTQKDRSRYLSRLSEYDRSEYTHVLYFTETETIFERIKALSRYVNKLGIVWVREPTQVFKPRLGFVSLQAFLSYRL